MIDRLLDAIAGLGARRVPNCRADPCPWPTTDPHYHPNAFGRWLLRTR